jgi:hypothetical protein
MVMCYGERGRRSNGVGIVEIAAGILVGIWPQVFAYVVAVWLWAIIVNLLSGPGYYDIALRDLGLSIGALTLARLAQAHQLERQDLTAADTIAESGAEEAPRELAHPRN